jgi:hypothetical protein
MNYPEEWNELPKHERKKKLKELRRGQERRSGLMKKVRNWGIAIIVLVVGIVGFTQLTKKSPEQIEFEQEVKAVSLDGKVEEFPIEGREHVPIGTSVDYQTNPPTSGNHLAQPKEWGIFTNEIDDMQAVHSMEHGGIWISYKDINEEEIAVLEDIGKQNSQSTLVSPRSGNDNKIVVASWGKVMRLEIADKALIQKYIDTYKNQSPEKLAR